MALDTWTWLVASRLARVKVAASGRLGRRSRLADSVCVQSLSVPNGPRVTSGPGPIIMILTVGETDGPFQ